MPSRAILAACSAWPKHLKPELSASTTACRPPARRHSAASSKAVGAENSALKAWTRSLRQNTFQSAFRDISTSKMICESFAAGKIVREPVGFKNGYWVGAPGVFYAADEPAWYLTYRIRRPRGVKPDRGGEARIARSTDLQNWEDVWSVTKDKFDSASIERSAIHKGTDGQWHYFTSYVDPADGRWCVSRLKSNNVRKFAPAQAKPLFKPASLELEGIKDPWILAHDRAFYMFLSVALRTPTTSQQSHSTLDIYNTGEHSEYIRIVSAMV